MCKNIILFAHKAGQKKHGVDKTPYFIKSLINQNNNIFETKTSNDLFKNLNNLYLKNNSINGPKVNIGGDHSMSIATVADSIARHKNLKLIWMDAHCDINTYEKSTSKNYHGMPLSFLTGLDKNDNFNFIKDNIDFKNILYLGIRDIDPFEQDVLEKYNINFIPVSNINKNINQTLIEIDHFIKDDPVHFSFDVDVLDPNIMPSTGTKVPNGVELKPCKIIVDNMLEKNLISTDITELNLNIGNVEDRAKSLINLTYLFNNFIE